MFGTCVYVEQVHLVSRYSTRTGFIFILTKDVSRIYVCRAPVDRIFSSASDALILFGGVTEKAVELTTVVGSVESLGAQRRVNVD